MLVNLISGKSFVALTIFLTGGMGAVAATHVHAHDAATTAQLATARGHGSIAHQQGRTNTQSSGVSVSNTSDAGVLSTTAPTSASPQHGNISTDNGLLSGASLHGLCVAYRAHLMASGGASVNLQARMAHSQAFIRLAELATSKSETIVTLCTTQAGVSMDILPASSQATTSADNVTSSASNAPTFALGNRP